MCIRDRIGSSEGKITPLEEKVFIAAALAHNQTGRPLSTHTSFSTMGLEQLALLQAHRCLLYTSQANGGQPAPGTTSAENTQQDVSLPPIASTPTQGQTPAATDGQQRVEVQGDLNNALTQPQNQQQLNNVAVNSTLPRCV